MTMENQTSLALVDNVTEALAEVSGSIPALTLWRPWADWVVLGWKTIETRKHRRLRSLGKRPTLLAVHAAEKWDRTAISLARPWLTDDQIRITDTVLRQRSVGGHVIGTVLVTSFMQLDDQDEPRALIECRSVIRYGLDLANPKPIATPVKVRGRQGLFRVVLPALAIREHAATGRPNGRV